jgi:flavin reductase (DIM6/NTAB) family NADH-FMN oxidoreductase RutF
MAEVAERCLPIDSAFLRRGFSFFPSGVVAVCAQIGNCPVGMVVSTFIPVSLDPPLVAFCAHKSSCTWPKLRTASHLGLTLLDESQYLTARQLSARAGDRFAGLSLETDEQGAIFLADCPAVLECSIRSEIEAGDHYLIVLEVHEFELRGEKAPLVFHKSGFRSLRNQLVVAAI